MNRLINKKMISPALSKGHTLIELMITLVLSLMITYAIAQVLISSNRSSVTTDGMSQSQETGRFVMSYLAGHIRMAGSRNSETTKNTQAIIPCPAGGLVSVARPGVAAGEVACTTDSALGDTQLTIYNAGTHGDRLAIALIPEVPLNAAGVEDPDLIQDCSGTTGYGRDDIILNVFWVRPDGNGMNSLMCQGHTFTGTAITRSNPIQAIANGVESMHVLFGEGVTPLPENDNRNVGRYVAVADVDNWDRIYSMKVSLLTRSITNATNNSVLRRYVLLNSAPYLMNDAISRQVFNTTFFLENSKPIDNN